MNIPRLTDMIRISDYLYEIPTSFRSDMNVPARVYMTEQMYHAIKDDRSLLQLVNMTTLPGIQKYAIAMPDIHQGYGFPIGGVAATDIQAGGVISPGGIGYDINCGVRLLKTDALISDILSDLPAVATALFRAVPSGVGRGGSFTCSLDELDQILLHGAHQLVKQGYGTQEDREFCQANGRMMYANPELVSYRAKMRGIDQLGTLGSGNHFLEIQMVDEIYDDATAHAYGLSKNMATIMIHCGSRGLGHQVCTDYIKIMHDAFPQLVPTLADRELIYAPAHSTPGKNYVAALSAASNFAWANRHLITHAVRKVWHTFFGQSASVATLYDLSHNIGEYEIHEIDGVQKQLFVHRKGATRAFGPGRPEVPTPYQSVGQPVFIPGTMGTASYVLAGTSQSMIQSFGSSCHGAGRVWSRAHAKKRVQGATLRASLERAGIIVRSGSDAGLAEEAPSAYKDIEQVVTVMHETGIAKKVARLRPRVVIKGE